MHYLGMCLEALKKTAKIASHVSQGLSRDLETNTPKMSLVLHDFVDQLGAR
jgi:hypothetical protein